LAAESALIEGEAVAVCPDGHSDFAALRTKARSARACLVAFDLLNLNGEDLRQHPIKQRRAALSPLVAGVDSVLFSDALVAQGALVFAKACELGLESYPLMGGAVPQICGAYNVKRVALQGNDRHRECPDW
jgi:bifunctional non-homologous end joining protein LigD